MDIHVLPKKKTPLNVVPGDIVKGHERTYLVIRNDNREGHCINDVEAVVIEEGPWGDPFVAVHDTQETVDQSYVRIGRLVGITVQP